MPNLLPPGGGKFSNAPLQQPAGKVRPALPPAGKPLANAQASGGNGLVVGIQAVHLSSIGGLNLGNKNFVVDLLARFGAAPDSGQQQKVENSVKSRLVKGIAVLVLVAAIALVQLFITESGPMSSTTLLNPSGSVLSMLLNQPRGYLSTLGLLPNSTDFNASAITPSATLVMYELFYSEEAYEHLHRNLPYRPLCVYPGKVRPNSSDIDGPDLFPLIQDTVYQGLMCEYGGIIAVANHLEDLRAGEVASWVAFISWRAFQKASAISEELMTKMETHMKLSLERGGPPDGDPLNATAGTNILYYWADWGPPNMYGNCNMWHDACTLVYAVVLERMFAENGTRPMTAVDYKNLTQNDAFLPGLPETGSKWSLMSYWALHRDLLAEYVDFTRMFVVTMESIWDLHGDVDRCPLVFRGLPYTNRLCWCFILERLINIWAFHRGLHMVFVRVGDGDFSASFNLADRDLMSQYFAKENMAKYLKGFPSRLSPEQLDFYKQLGGKV